MVSGILVKDKKKKPIGEKKEEVDFPRGGGKGSDSRRAV